uniref:Uncharacterized protein n=1 Tax=Spumella elongata TaxID=89044 RepID=A0A7S3M730_9STRA
MPTPKALSANSDTVYVIHTLYSAAGGVCDDAILSRFAYANFHCFATSPTTSMMYSCSSEYICYYYEYSDDICNTYLNGYEMALGTCKVTDEDDDGYVSDGGAGIVFLSQGLTAQVGLPAPLPGTSLTNSYYSSTDCNAEIGIFESRQTYQSTCYSNYNGQNYSSTMYVEPNQMNYDAYGCDTNYLSSTTYLPFAQCFVSSDYLSSYSLAFTTEVPSTSLPTESPTDSPTDSPTEFPTFYSEFTAAPTDYPTESPTTSTADTYFIVRSYYGATGAICSYDVLSKTAYRTNFCIETNSYTSEKYICNSETDCYFYEYSDSYCSNQVNSSVVELGICQSTDADDDGYVTDSGAFMSQMTTAQLGPPTPLAGTSLTTTYYSLQYCNPNSVIYMLRLSFPYTCYNNFDGQNPTSTRWDLGYITTYSTFDCVPGTEIFSQYAPVNMCQNGPSIHSNQIVVTDFAAPTAQPSMAPSMPTPSPTDYPTYFPTTPKVDYDAVVGTTLAGFSAMAVINTLLFFFQPPQDTSSVSQTSNPAEAEKASEF